MAREAQSFRAARRNVFIVDRRTVAPKHRKDHRWKSSVNAKAVEAPPVKQNKRDRSPEAEQYRKDRSITMDFTGSVQGLSRALINRALQTISQKKPKRGWAAKSRRWKWRDTTTEKERMRHAWYRKAKTASDLDANVARLNETVGAM